MEVDGPHALSAAAFAGFPGIEEPDLDGVELGEAGARLLASRRWERLEDLSLFNCRISGAGVAALARGEWPALDELDLRANGLGARASLEEPLGACAAHAAPGRAAVSLQKNLEQTAGGAFAGGALAARTRARVEGASASAVPL